MDELTDYRTNIERLAELDSSEVFSNGKTEHAAIIFETFLKFSKDSVVFFCKDLNKDVFDMPSIINSMENALRRKVRISILTQEIPTATKLLEAYNDQWLKADYSIDIKTATSSVIKAFDANFCVMDEKAYRFEPDRGEPVAFACMNNPAIAKNILSFFGTAEQMA
jgi:hypothetical protein